MHRLCRRPEELAEIQAPVPSNALLLTGSFFKANVKLSGPFQEFSPDLAEVLPRPVLGVGNPYRLQRNVEPGHLPWSRLLFLSAKQLDGGAVWPVDRTVRQYAVEYLNASNQTRSLPLEFEPSLAIVSYVTQLCNYRSFMLTTLML